MRGICRAKEGEKGASYAKAVEFPKQTLVPDRVICFFEIKESNPGGFRATMAGSCRVMEVENLLEAFVFRTEAMLFRDYNITRATKGRKTIVEEAKDEFPKGGEHREGAVIIQVIGVAFFEKQDNDTLTDRFWNFTVDVDVIDNVKEITRVGIVGEGKKIVRNIIWARCFTKGKVVDSIVEFFACKGCVK